MDMKISAPLFSFSVRLLLGLVAIVLAWGQQILRIPAIYIGVATH